MSLLSCKKVLLVTETPPGTPNGFGVTLECLFKEVTHIVIFTDAEFKAYAEKEEYVLAQVPNHKSRRLLFPYLLGKIPEWRGFYSSRWLSKLDRNEFKALYVFNYSLDCLKFANWIAQKFEIPLFVHIADHSIDFEKGLGRKIISNCEKVLCITDEMRQKYETVIGRNDIEVLHNGAEEVCFNIPPPPSFPFSEKNPFYSLFYWRPLFILTWRLHRRLFSRNFRSKKKISMG